MKQKGSKADNMRYDYSMQCFVSRTTVRIKSSLVKPAEEVCGEVPAATPKRLEY